MLRECGVPRLRSILVLRRPETPVKHTVQEILDVAKQLPASERRRLVHEIEERLAAENDEPAHEGIDMFLALAGTGHSEHTDVSSSKGKHLAEVYAGPLDPK